MCYLRGIVMLRMGRAKDAQESLMEALAIDYKNFDAFEALVGGEMMTIDEGIFSTFTPCRLISQKLGEEWGFIQALQYHHDDPYASEFVRSIYTVRLKKVKRTLQHFKTLANERYF